MYLTHKKERETHTHTQIQTYNSTIRGVGELVYIASHWFLLIFLFSVLASVVSFQFDVSPQIHDASKSPLPHWSMSNYGNPIRGSSMIVKKLKWIIQYTPT